MGVRGGEVGEGGWRSRQGPGTGGDAQGEPWSAAIPREVRGRTQTRLVKGKHGFLERPTSRSWWGAAQSVQASQGVRTGRTRDGGGHRGEGRADLPWGRLGGHL